MLRWFIAALGLIGLCLITLAPNPAQAADDIVYVDVSRAYLRRGPGVEYAQQNLVEENTALTVTSRRGNWLKVTPPLGDDGWILKRATTSTPPPEVQIAALKERIATLESTNGEAEARIRTLADSRQDVELQTSQLQGEVLNLKAELSALESDRTFAWACLGVVVMLLGFALGFFSGMGRRQAESRHQDELAKSAHRGVSG